MKDNVTVCVLGNQAEEFCKVNAKKGGESDYRLWHEVYAGKVITLCEPFRWPEKPSSLAYCLALADHIVIAHDAGDAAFGEALVALDLLEKKSGCFAGDYGLSAYAKGTAVEGYAVKTVEEAGEWVRALPTAKNDGETKVLADSSFNVKGVGSIALGFVARGMVRIHDSLFVNPGKEKIDVRSIQVQDVDVSEAGAGARVGLCFKGATVEAITRGSVLSPAHQAGILEGTFSLKKSKFCRGELPKRLHAFNGFQGQPCDAEPVEGGVHLVFEQPFVWDNEIILLCDLNRPAPRFVAACGKQ
ncbi:MAG: EF-Tu/IF-2/RF-3 family GTPase [Candidatus Micrarchaeia archaeon]